MTPMPKPQRRAPKPRKRIPRASRPRQRSESPQAALIRRMDREWADAVKTRARGLCEWCVRLVGPMAGTDAHHVFGKKAHPSMRHETANGIYLCRRSHDGAHHFPDVFKAWFRSNFKQRWERLMELQEVSR